MAVGDSIQIVFDPEYSDSGYTYCVAKKIVTTFAGTQGEQIDFFINWSLKVIDEAQTIILQEGIGPIGLNYTEHDLPMILRGALLNGIVYGDTTTTSIANHNTKKVSDFCLFQNYPNPFNSSTKIRFNIPNLSIVTLKMYNVMSEEIATIINKRQLIGTSEVLLNSENYPSGCYIYQIKTDTYSESKKLLIQK
jgi:hypothetical protein